MTSGRVSRFANRIVTIVIICAVSVVWYLVGHNAWMRFKAPSEDYQLNGGKIRHSARVWEGKQWSVVLVLSTSCKYCERSMDSYRALIQTARAAAGSEVQIVAAFPQAVEESSAYLEQHGVSADRVLSLNPNVFGIGGTPVLMLVARQGIIKHAWSGAVDAQRRPIVEASILKELHMKDFRGEVTYATPGE